MHPAAKTNLVLIRCPSPDQLKINKDLKTDHTRINICSGLLRLWAFITKIYLYTVTESDNEESEENFTSEHQIT